MPDLDLDSANELRRAVGEIVRVIRRTEDTPEGQIETLGFLVRDGAQSIASLARRRRVRHQSMSGTVAELEVQGLVTRSADPNDARSILVALTSDGVEMIRASRLRRSTLILDAARGVLSPAERELLTEVAAVFDRLTAELNERATG